MNPFIQQLVDDLKEFSTELLAPGLQTAQQVASTSLGTVASTSALLKSIDLLTSLIPKLVKELQTIEATHKVMLRYAPVPKNAGFSRRPSDFQLDNARRLLPTQWLEITPLEELDVDPLRWLLHLLNAQENALDKIQDRTTKYIDDSLVAQQGDSYYARHDRATLVGMRTRLNEAQTKLDQARVILMRTAQIRLLPSATLPTPYPRSPSWLRLRQYAQQLLNPQDYLPTFLYTLLHGTVEIADTPYLYQRWCGVKLLKMFEKIGWRCSDEPTGALFLGGEIKMYKADVKISLWVEPRFSKHRMHPSGFMCREVSETHPDYMIVTPGPYGVDAFILDPTTTINETVRRSKGKYLDTIETRATVAGISLMRYPLRAWSAAPSHTPHCEVEDTTGQTGTIPMHPLDWSPLPLQSWLKDIDNYAIAWGHFLSGNYQ